MPISSPSAMSITLPQQLQTETQELPLETWRTEALLKGDIDKATIHTWKETINNILTAIHALFCPSQQEAVLGFTGDMLKAAINATEFQKVHTISTLDLILSPKNQLEEKYADNIKILDENFMALKNMAGEGFQHEFTKQIDFSNHTTSYFIKETLITTINLALDETLEDGSSIKRLALRGGYEGIHTQQF
ncbi:hypothetical protein [uncultured Shewanella sp.]|uniref:hypothetical protein n=1 Tax=uncultured Shewanella sp. TaxID=173975 RepID=UPI0026221A51|nr:hypothetical protein [uncultured Shewanella sp.]